MKKTRLFFSYLFLGLLLLSCNKNEFDFTVERIPLKGTFIAVPQSTETSYCSEYNSHINVNIPLVSEINGYFDGLKTIYSNKSSMSLNDCYLDIDNRKLTVYQELVMKNMYGDGFRMIGSAEILIDGPATGAYEIVEGYGMYAGKTGWFKTYGKYNVETGEAEFSGEGSVTMFASPQ